MSRSIRKHFNELLKEHDAKKPSHQSGYRRNIGKRSRKEINVAGRIHDISGLFETFGSESDPPSESSPIPVSSSSNRRSVHGEAQPMHPRGASQLQEGHPSAPKKSRRSNADARIQNLTVSIGTQTLQDIDLCEDEESDESSFADDDRPNVTYRHIGTQMELTSVRRKSKSFQHARAGHRSRLVDVVYKDADTSMRQSGSYPESSWLETTRAKGDSNQSGSGGYSSLNKRQNRSTAGGAEIQPHDRTSQKRMLSPSSNTELRSRSSHTSRMENTPQKALESERQEGKTPGDGRSILDEYTEMIDSQKKLASSPSVGDSRSMKSSRKTHSAKSLRKRLSFRADANPQSPFAPSKEPVIIQDLIPSTDHGDVPQVELDVYDSVSPPKSAKKYAQRRFSKLRSIRTEPKLSQNYDEQSSNLAASAPRRHSSQNHAKRELSFSGKYPSREEPAGTKKLTLSSKAKKSLDYQQPVENSSRKSETRSSRRSKGGNQRSTYLDSVAYSLVNYSVSDEDSAHDEADLRLLKSGQSQKKRRRSTRSQHGIFKSMREENMASEVKSVAMMKSSKKRDKYEVTSDDDGNVIRLSASKKRKPMKSRIPVPSSHNDFDSESSELRAALSSKQRKLTAKKIPVKRIISDTSSDREEDPTVIENASYPLTSPREVNNKYSPGTCGGIRAPRDIADQGDGPIVGTQNVREWLRTEGQGRDEIVPRDITLPQAVNRRSKYSSHDSGANNLQSFGDASIIRDKGSTNFDRLRGDMNNFGPPSSTPRVTNPRKTKPATGADEEEGEKMAGAVEEGVSGISNDSYTMPRRRKSRTKEKSTTVPKAVASPPKANTPSYQPTPKYRKTVSPRKRLTASFYENNPDNAAQPETNDTLTAIGPPPHDELSGSPINNIEDDIHEEAVSHPGTAKKNLSTVGQQGSTGKRKKNTKSKATNRKKSTKRNQPTVSDDNNAVPISESEDYVVLPLPTTSDENGEVRRSSRIRTKVFAIGEGFEYSNTFDEHGFPKIIGIRVRKNSNTANAKKGSRKKNTKTRSKTTARKTQKKGKKTKGQGTVKNSTNVAEPDDNNSATLPIISEEPELPEISGESMGNQTMPISERTVNLLNSTTNSYNTIDLLSIVSHDGGRLGPAHQAHQIVPGVEITRGINLSECGLSSTVQGRVVIKPRKRKAERRAGSGTMCFFVHQGSLELTLSGETVLVPRSSYFQVPHKNSYSLYNPDNKIDAVLFYSLSIERSVLEET